MTDPPPPTRRTLALLAAAAAAFTLYGSLVPLTFVSRPAGDVADAFARAMGRVRLDSRTDVAVNVLLGVPLGFGLLGACRLDRPGGRRRDAVTGFALLPGCGLFAAAVEAAQLYVPARNCSGADVLCQIIGSTAGMAGWALAGRRLVGHLRPLARRAGGGAAAQLLGGYVLLVVLVQLLPLDLDPNPRDLYRKARDHARWEPFAEFRGVDADRAWGETAKLLTLAGLFLPGGLLVAQLGRRGQWTGVWLLAGLAFGTEAAQLGIASRSPGTTDAVVGIAGAVAGWVVGRAVRGRRALTQLVLGLLWTGLLLVVYWQPFDFRPRPLAFDWVPAAPLESGHPLHALEEMLTKAVLFAPVGVLAGHRLRLGVVVGLLVATAIEVGQLDLPGRTPGVTDVLLGGAGAFLGSWSYRRVRQPDVC